MSFAVTHKNKISKSANSESTHFRPFPRKNDSDRKSQDHFSHLQRTFGRSQIEFNFAKLGIQPKLKISQPNDPYEQEADRVAEQVMRMQEPDNISPRMTKKGEIDRKCATCETKKEEKGEKLKVSRKSSNSLPLNATGGIAEINKVRSSNGHPLDATTKTFAEQRFGFNFSNVRIHTDQDAARSANSVNALAYTMGSDIVFGEGQYQPSTESGKKLLAHELTHIVQRNDYSHHDRLTMDRKEDPDDSSKKAAGQPGQILENVARNCASCAACEAPDTAGAGSGSLKWGELTIAVDREEKTLLKAIKSHNVGHTWIKLQDNLGNKYSYGFWPQDGFDPDNPGSTVPGCVVHPDGIHDPEMGGSAVEYLDIKYRLNVEQYRAALDYVVNTCKSVPNYNLFRFNCTTFAINAAKAAGISPPHSTTLAIHNPNALAKGIIRSKRRMRRRGK